MGENDRMERQPGLEASFPLWPKAVALRLLPAQWTLHLLIPAPYTLLSLQAGCWAHLDKSSH